MAGKLRRSVRSNMIGVVLFAAISGTAWAGTELEDSGTSKDLRHGGAVFPGTQGDNGDDGPFASKDCARPRKRPTRIVLRCADFGILINGIDWKSWESRRAKGGGRLHFRTCRPRCGAYPVKIELHKVRRELCETEDRRLPMFQRIRLDFPRQRPKRADPPEKLDCSP
jgi:hypothetical protein